MAMSYLHDCRGERLFDVRVPCLDRVPQSERKVFLAMLARGVNSPLTSSCGRLFDAVAALLGVRLLSSYEGQAAIELEGLAEGAPASGCYPYSIEMVAGAHGMDLRPMIEALLLDLDRGVTTAVLARRFHDTLAAAAAEMCTSIRGEEGTDRVVLSGGVFQNKLLTEALHARLAALGFRVFSHRLVPPNDGGLALGQAIVAARRYAADDTGRRIPSPPVEGVGTGGRD
jgi:hydrogenase maturation protein HypF